MNSWTMWWGACYHVCQRSLDVLNPIEFKIWHTCENWVGIIESRANVDLPSASGTTVWTLLCTIGLHAILLSMKRYYVPQSYLLNTSYWLTWQTKTAMYHQILAFSALSHFTCGLVYTTYHKACSPSPSNDFMLGSSHCTVIWLQLIMWTKK